MIEFSTATALSTSVILRPGLVPGGPADFDLALGEALKPGEAPPDGVAVPLPLVLATDGAPDPRQAIAVTGKDLPDGEPESDCEALSSKETDDISDEADPSFAWFGGAPVIADAPLGISVPGRVRGPAGESRPAGELRFPGRALAEAGFARVPVRTAPTATEATADLPSGDVPVAPTGTTTAAPAAPVSTVPSNESVARTVDPVAPVTETPSAPTVAAAPLSPVQRPVIRLAANWEAVRVPIRTNGPVAPEPAATQTPTLPAAPASLATGTPIVPTAPVPLVTGTPIAPAPAPAPVSLAPEPETGPMAPDAKDIQPAVAKPTFEDRPVMRVDPSGRIKLEPVANPATPVPTLRTDAPVAPAPVVMTPLASAPALAGAQPAAIAFAAARAGSPEQPERRIQPRDVAQGLSMLTPGAGALRPQTVAPAAQAQDGQLDMRRDDWMGSMIERIETMRDAGGTQETRLRLTPDSLGTLDVSIRQEGDRVHIRFATDNAQARALIAEAQPRLAEIADARGLRLGQASVETGAQGQGQPQPRAQESSQPLAPRSAFTGGGAADEAASDQRIA